MITTFQRVLLCVVLLLLVCSPSANHTHAQPERSKEGNAVNVHYLEIVTPEVDATCAALEKLHEVSFGVPVAEFGGARTATLESGGRIGVRAPMRETEEPVVRPYVLVDDIETAVEAAKAAGGEIAIPPTEIPDQGRFAIYIMGGIQYGLWQL